MIYATSAIFAPRLQRSSSVARFRGRRVKFDSEPMYKEWFINHNVDWGLFCLMLAISRLGLW